MPVFAKVRSLATSCKNLQEHSQLAQANTRTLAGLVISIEPDAKKRGPNEARILKEALESAAAHGIWLQAHTNCAVRENAATATYSNPPAVLKEVVRLQEAVLEGWTGIPDSGLEKRFPNEAAYKEASAILEMMGTGYMIEFKFPPNTDFIIRVRGNAPESVRLLEEILEKERGGRAL